MAAQSTAEVVWQGDLPSGSGTVKPESGTYGELPVTWASRTERSRGKTSPEELLASAHAACFAMALSGALGKAQRKAERIAIRATATFEVLPAGPKVTTMELQVRGRVPGLNAQQFEEAVRAADGGCPISNALRGNVDIRVRAELEG